LGGSTARTVETSLRAFGRMLNSAGELVCLAKTMTMSRLGP